MLVVVGKGDGVPVAAAGVFPVGEGGVCGRGGYGHREFGIEDGKVLCLKKGEGRISPCLIKEGGTKNAIFTYSTTVMDLIDNLSLYKSISITG